MPLTIAEALADLAPVVDLVDQVEAAVAAMPPKAERKASDYAKAFGAAPDGPLAKVAALFDAVEAQIKS